MDPTIGVRVTVDPHVMRGKPVIRGTRIPVEMIVRMLSQGVSERDVLEEYPGLEIADVRAALGYAAAIVANEDVFPLTGSD
jgi:uncharacterized protein (DUF433 family)